jgi:hypothetical protein
MAASADAKGAEFTPVMVMVTGAVAVPPDLSETV